MNIIKTIHKIIRGDSRQMNLVAYGSNNLAKGNDNQYYLGGVMFK